MFRNSRRKFMISKKQIFQSKKVRSRSGIRELVPNNDVDSRNVKIFSKVQHSNESLVVNRNLENESRNELQTLQKWGNNKLVSDKEFDIKIYNASDKEGLKTSDEESSIINKLSGSSIIIVYENGPGNKKSGSEVCSNEEPCKNNKSSTDLVERKLCNDVGSSVNVKVTRSSRSNDSRFKDINSNPSSQCSSIGAKKNVIIQCGSPKRSKNKDTGRCEGKSVPRETNRLKLIPPETLAEPKCLKIVKKAVNNEPDLIPDLSNMMTGGRLIKTLKSFLGDHSNNEETKSSYVEIVQKLDESNEKHKILIFKRQIEKCQKCKEEDESQNCNPDNPPESNIIRLTMKKDRKNKREKNDDVSVSSINDKIPSELHQPLCKPNAIVGSSNSHVAENTKHKLSLLRNSMLPNSSYNILLASTLNELAGTLNTRNSTKLSKSSKENLDEVSVSTKSNSFRKGSVEKSALNSERSLKKTETSEKIQSASQSIKSQVSTCNSSTKKSLCTNENKRSNFSASVKVNNEVSVLCPPKVMSRKIENYDSVSQKSESTDLSRKYQETIPSDEICKVELEDSEYNCLEKTSKEITSDIKIYKKSVERKGSCAAKTSLSADQPALPNVQENCKTEENKPSSKELSRPVYRSLDYSKPPSIENDNSFLQLLDPKSLQKMGKNEFLVNPEMKNTKTEYYMLKKSYAAPIALNRIASAESLKSVEPPSLETSRGSSALQMKESAANVSTTDSDDTVVKVNKVKKTEWPHKFDDQSSYMKEKQNHFKLDFMNFGMHRQLDSFISCENEQRIEPFESIPSNVKCKLDLNSRDKKKKKKNALWQMKENACKIMRSSHTSRRKDS